MANIYLFRHGQTTHNQKGLFTGWESNTEFTPLGLLQNQHCAFLLKNIKFDLAIHTSLKRSQETLTTVLGFHPECTDIRTDDRMRERNYGNLNNTLHSDFIKAHGQEAFDKIHRGWDDKDESGESYADLEIRIKSFISWLQSDFSTKDINIAISGHGNSIRIFRHIIESAQRDITCSWTITYASIFAYKI